MADSEVQNAGQPPEPSTEEAAVAAPPVSEPAPANPEPAPESTAAQAEAAPQPEPEPEKAKLESEAVQPTGQAAAAEEPLPGKKEPSQAEAATVDASGEDEEEDTPFEKLVSRARRFSEARVKTILESLLFVTDKPLTVEAIQQTTGIMPLVIKDHLEKLQGHYRDGVRGIVLHEVSGGWQFRTCPSTSDFVRRFLKVKPQRLTRAALETLAIIAYRQPVTRPEIEDIRAVDCGAVVKALLDRQLIKIIGKKEEPGRPLLYGTTPQFLEFFALRDLASLPTLREFQELNEESQAIVEQQTGGKAEEKKGTDNLVADLRDSKLEERLKQTTAEADSALADLETAIADTDTKTKATVRILNPVPPEGLAPPSGPGAPQPGTSQGDVAAADAEQADDLPEGRASEDEAGGEEPGEPEEDEGGAADDEVPPEMDDDDDE